MSHMGNCNLWGLQIRRWWCVLTRRGGKIEGLHTETTSLLGILERSMISKRSDDVQGGG